MILKLAFKRKYLKLSQWVLLLNIEVDVEKVKGDFALGGIFALR